MNILLSSCYSNSLNFLFFIIIITICKPLNVNIIRWGYTCGQSGFITKQVLREVTPSPVVWNDFIVFFGMKNSL